MSSNIPNYRLLKPTDTVREGDTFYNVETNSWDKVAPSRLGMLFDPTDSNPVRRLFKLPKSEKPVDIDPKKKEVKKYDLRKANKSMYLLIRVGTKLTCVDFNPTRFSPKKDFVYVRAVGTTEEIAEWFRTDDVENWIVDVLAGHEMDEFFDKDPIEGVETEHSKRNKGKK